MAVARILALTLAASLGVVVSAGAQDVSAELRTAMQALDKAFYAVNAAEWERYTAPTFTTVQDGADFPGDDGEAGVRCR